MPPPVSSEIQIGGKCGEREEVHEEEQGGSEDGADGRWGRGRSHGRFGDEDDEIRRRPAPCLEALLLPSRLGKGKFWVSDPYTVRDPSRGMGLVFR